MTIQQKIDYLKALKELLEKIDTEIDYCRIFRDGEYEAPDTEDYNYGQYMAWKTLREKAEKLLMI